MTRADVLVVGGGIVGAAVAVQCARRGMRVTLCERRAIAGEASSLDLALLAPSLCPPALRPLAEAGVAEYLALHRFTGGAFLLDRSVPDDDDLRRIDPGGAAAALVEEARSYRATILTACHVKHLEARGGRVFGARTDAGDVPAGTTVVAGGVSSWRACRNLGVDVPVRGEAGEVLVTAPAPFALERPVAAGDAWVAQDEAGRLVAADPERAVQALPGLRDLPVLERRTLTAPVTEDGLPLHGPVAGWGGVVLCCGHGRHGVACAPAAGAEIAEGIAAGTWKAAG